MELRRLRPGDDPVVERLATKTKPARATELLADERTFFLVAFEAGEPIGLVLAYELIRRHGEPSHVFVYEVDVDERFRRRGVATALMRELERLAVERGIRSGFVLASESNEPAMRLYESLGGIRPYHDDVMWDFEYSVD